MRRTKLLSLHTPRITGNPCSTSLNLRCIGLLSLHEHPSPLEFCWRDCSPNTKTWTVFPLKTTCSAPHPSDGSRSMLLVVASNNVAVAKLLSRQSPELLSSNACRKPCSIAKGLREVFSWSRSYCQAHQWNGNTVPWGLRETRSLRRKTTNMVLISIFSLSWRNWCLNGRYLYSFPSLESMEMQQLHIAPLAKWPQERSPYISRVPKLGRTLWAKIPRRHAMCFAAVRSW